MSNTIVEDLSDLKVNDYYKLIVNHNDKQIILSEKSKLLNNSHDFIFSFSDEAYNNVNEEDMINVFKQTGSGIHIMRTQNNGTVTFHSNLPNNYLTKVLKEEMLLDSSGLGSYFTNVNIIIKRI